MTDYCFGCKNLQFHETKNMLYGWWNCKLRRPNDALVGQVGGVDLICEPPVQNCGGKWVYEVAQ